ncbi:uncharacterized protein LOC131675981 [Topomyia yanbarensis]|uniref:uncharacterized protein LOC131675981 n=1 Tax=Topomyia yanbarensis TaxID=2498891 RepID=UPI00273BCE35|nr:uncharacterized protein LOC131675981 [Topomyia yanbarensis]
MEDPVEDPTLIWRKQLASLENSITPIARAAEDTSQEDDLVTLVVQQEILTSLYEQACTIILKIEGRTGHSNRREALLPIYVKARSAQARKIRTEQQSETNQDGRYRPQLDQSIILGSSRTDHLPRLELPKFHGSATEWLSFKARFEKCVSTLTEDANKYVFLTKCLEYESARNTCEALENSGLPFNEALIKLEGDFIRNG